MAKINEKQKKKLSNLAHIADMVDKGNFAIVAKLFELVDRLEELEDVKKGDKGEQGLQGERGLQGKEGKQGIQGETGKIGPMGLPGKNGRDGKDGEVGKDGNIKEVSPQELRDLLELLRDDDRLSITAVRGLDEYLNEIGRIKKRIQEPMLHPVALGNLPDVNVVGVTIGQTIVWNGTYWAPGNSSGGGFTESNIVSGAINSSNTTFVMDAVCKYIIVAGVWYRQNAGWTSGGGNTIIMDFPPATGSDLWGVVGTQSTSNFLTDKNGNILTDSHGNPLTVN